MRIQKTCFNILTGRQRHVLLLDLHGLAGKLANDVPDQQAVWLLLEEGEAFSVAFVACLMAGVTAMPLPAPDVAHLEGQLAYWRKLCESAPPALVLACGSGLELLDDASLPWQAPLWDALAHVGPANEPLQSCDDHRALLLYTSGSTAAPKGVSLRAEQLFYNARTCCEVWDIQSDAVLVSWMPNHHSFGLVFNVLLPLFAGCDLAAIAPRAFMKDPAIWLRLMSDYRGTHSAAATFGYQMCAEHVSDGQLPEDLDLSSWRVGLISAEPIRRSAYDRFYARFSRHGLRSDWFSPLFGMSECGPVTAMPAGEPARFHEDESLPHELQLACVGRALPGSRVEVVDPQTRMVAAEGQSGEVWLHGPSVLDAYVGDAASNAAAFAELVDEQVRFFRTGDRGFFKDGMLYINGRIKETIIVRGKKFYPQDIELAFVGADARLQGEKCVAFARGEGNETVLHLLLESVTPLEDRDALRNALHAGAKAVWAALGLPLQSVSVVARGQLPRTAGGKLQRLRAGRIFAAAGFAIEAGWQRDEASAPQSQGTLAQDPVEAICQLLANVLAIDASEVEADIELAEYMMDSRSYMKWAADIEAALQVKVNPTLFYKVETIEELVTELGLERCS